MRWRPLHAQPPVLARPLRPRTPPPPLHFLTSLARAVRTQPGQRELGQRLGDGRADERGAARALAGGRRHGAPAAPGVFQPPPRPRLPGPCRRTPARRHPQRGHRSEGVSCSHQVRLGPPAAHAPGAGPPGAGAVGRPPRRPGGPGPRAPAAGPLNVPGLRAGVRAVVVLLRVEGGCKKDVGQLRRRGGPAGAGPQPVGFKPGVAGRVQSQAAPQASGPPALPPPASPPW